MSMKEISKDGNSRLWDVLQGEINQHSKNQQKQYLFYCQKW